MDLEDIYANAECRNIEDTSGAQTRRNSQDEGKVGKLRPQTLLLMTVSLGLICALLLVFIIWLNISITAERDLLKRYETTVQEFNHTINSLQTNYTDLRTEEEQLKKSLNSLSQKNQECENNITSLSDELKTKASKQGWFFMTNEAKSWSEIRQFCRDHGADLVMIKTEEKQRIITSFIKESVWIGLTDSDTEGTMKWVDNSSLNQKFWRNGEPNNYIKDEDCVEMRLTGGSPPLNNWNDLPCSEMRKGICEK